jgi:hypothetical protein
VKVNAQAFFNFSARHVPLLRALTAREGEMSEAEAFRLVKAHANPAEELPETTWRRLQEYQIVVPTEPGSAQFLVAEPVGRLLTYLFDEANPATPEIIRGYIASLESIGRQFATALDREDLTVVELAFREVNVTLRRIYADLDETHNAILAEVARFKTTRHQITVRDKFRRIVHWMERFVEPMIDIVRADGPMRASFDETERLLRLARERALFNDHPAVERNLRFLRLVRKHALRVFQQCRREIQPLYEALRRSSFIAEGAAIALERLQREGLANWGSGTLIGIHQMRIQNVPSDQAIGLALRRVASHPPEPAPVVILDADLEPPASLVQRQWLDALPDRVGPELPVTDLLEWLVTHHPAKRAGEVLGGFTSLLFHPGFCGRFADTGEREYPLPDGVVRGHPLRLERAST